VIAERRGPGRPKGSTRTHCMRGHEFTPDSTYFSKGKRACRTCKLDRQSLRKPRTVRIVEQPHKFAEDYHVWATTRQVQLDGAVAEIVVDDSGNVDLITLRDGTHSRVVISPRDVGALISGLMAVGVLFSLPG
jgi:hypothetical protein